MKTATQYTKYNCYKIYARVTYFHSFLSKQTHLRPTHTPHSSTQEFFARPSDFRMRYPRDILKFRRCEIIIEKNLKIETIINHNLLGSSWSNQ